MDRRRSERAGRPHRRDRTGLPPASQWSELSFSAITSDGAILPSSSFKSFAKATGVKRFANRHFSIRGASSPRKMAESMQNGPDVNRSRICRSHPAGFIMHAALEIKILGVDDGATRRGRHGTLRDDHIGAGTKQQAGGDSDKRFHNLALQITVLRLHEGSRQLR